jgi:hypothetical protein
MAASVYTFNRRYTPPVGGREFEAGDKIPVKDITPELAKVLVAGGYCTAPKKRAAAKKTATKKT